MPDISRIVVRFPLLISVLVALAGGVWVSAVKLTNVERDLAELKEAKDKSWNALHMQLWCLSTERQNGKWRCADPKEIVRPHSTGPL